MPVMFYTLDDLNRIAPNLEEELGGTWSRVETDAGHWATLTTSDGYVFYSYEGGWWFVQAATAVPAQHERLVAGFLRAVDPAAAAQRVAERVVSNRTASVRSCQGPRMLELETSQNDDGEWITFFLPVLNEFYSTNPAC